MKIRFYNNNLIFLLLVLFLTGCTDEETTQPPDENTLINTSFEKEGQPYADGWTLPAGAKFSTDTPFNGGSYSLKLESTQAPEQYAYIKVPGKVEYNFYQLTFSAKYIDVRGRAILSIIRNGSVVKEVSISIDELDWSSYSIADTFNVAVGDSFMVQLTGGIVPFLPGETHFDLCKLQAVE